MCDSDVDVGALTLGVLSGLGVLAVATEFDVHDNDGATVKLVPSWLPTVAPGRPACSPVPLMSRCAYCSGRSLKSARKVGTHMLKNHRIGQAVRQPH